MRKGNLLTGAASVLLAGAITVSSVVGGNVIEGNAETSTSTYTATTCKITDSNNKVVSINKNENRKQLQGLCGNNKGVFYVFKINNKETSDLYRYDESEKKLSIVKKGISFTGHANDAAFVPKEDASRIYVATSRKWEKGNKGDDFVPEIVCMNTKGKLRGKYSVFIDGEHKEISQIAYYDKITVNGNKDTPRFIIKVRGGDEPNFYLGYLSNVCANNDKYNGRFVVQKQFRINRSAISKQLGDTEKYGIVLSGIYYKSGMLYVTAAKRIKATEEFVNESYIASYKLSDLTESKTNKKIDDAVMLKAERVITLKHGALKNEEDKFEIEGVHVKGDKIYFATNNINVDVSTNNNGKKTVTQVSAKDALYSITK